MGFWDGIGKAAGEVALNYAATQEANRLLDLGKALARRELKRTSKDADQEGWQRLINMLDGLARANDGERSELAAELAEYAETLL
jgi:hypothetical protein